MRHLDDPAHWIDRPQRVRYVRKRQQASPRAEQRFQLGQKQLALLVDRRDAQLGSLFLAEQLPWNDVGVVLHRRDQNFVTGLQARTDEGMRDQVDRFRRSLHEHDFSRL